MTEGNGFRDTFLDESYNKKRMERAIEKSASNGTSLLSKGNSAYTSAFKDRTKSAYSQGGAFLHSNPSVQHDVDISYRTSINDHTQEEP